MSVKDTIQKITHSRVAGNFVRAGAMGAALMGAAVGRGATPNEKAEASSEPVAINRYAEPLPTTRGQQNIQDQLKLNSYLATVGVYDADRDANVDKEAFPSISKYALQLDAQLACAGESAGTRHTVVSGAVDYVFRPLAGNTDITFGDYSLNPKGLRDFWAASGSSIDLSNGLNLVLKYPNSATGENNDKPAFIINVPQSSLTSSIKQISYMYDKLESSGVTQVLEESAADLTQMSAEEQKAFAQKMMADFNSGDLEKRVSLDPDLKEQMKKDLLSAIPRQYSVSVIQNGRIREAVESDAEIFYDMVVSNIMDMNDKGAIDLGDIAARETVGNTNEESSGFFGTLGRWGRKAAGAAVSITASCLPDSVLRGQIDAKAKEPIINSFNQVVAQQRLNAQENNNSASFTDFTVASAENGGTSAYATQFVNRQSGR